MSHYARYLRSQEWMAVKCRYRASKLPQDCVVCGAERVDLHHRTYARLGNERLADLVPLCRTCHSAAHALLKRKRSSKKLTIRSVVPRLRKFYLRRGRLPRMDERWGLTQRPRATGRGAA